jgi:hypothetical protein
MQRFVSAFLAAVVAITGAAASFTPAQAGIMPRMAAAMTDAAPAAGVVQIRHQRTWRHRGHRRYRGSRYYQRRFHSGRRYSYSRHDSYRPYRHYHRHRYYHRDRYYRRDRDDHVGAAVVLGIAGLAAGAIIAGQGHGGSSYHAICARKYRSYDPRSGTYLGYDGYRHRCRY